jgi:hypothetical protein
LGALIVRGPASFSQWMGMQAKPARPLSCSWSCVGQSEICRRQEPALPKLVCSSQEQTRRLLGPCCRDPGAVWYFSSLRLQLCFGLGGQPLSTLQGLSFLTFRGEGPVFFACRPRAPRLLENLLGAFFFFPCNPFSIYRVFVTHSGAFLI